jgi:hypothetical protein
MLPIPARLGFAPTRPAADLSAASTTFFIFMLLQIPKYLDVVSPLLLLIFLFSRGNIKISRDYIFWFIIAQFVLNLIAKILFLQGQNNLVFYNINCILSFLLISAYFWNILYLRKKNLIIISMVALFGLFCIFDYIKLENFRGEFNSNIYGVASFIMVTYCLLYYLEKLKFPSRDKITKSSNFWFVTGILTYYSGCFFIFINYKTLSTTQDLKNGILLLWQIQNVIFMIMFVYFFIGMICKPYPETYR